MSRSSRRGPWLPEEDATLLHLVRSQGPNNWVRISQHMQHRSPKQCRERYHQNLKPTLNHEPISVEEGEVIEQLVQEMGKRWADIARRLGNRSDNAVKNWWNGSMNRRKRNHFQHNGESRILGYRTLPIPASGAPRPIYVHEPQMSPPQLDGYSSHTPLSLRRREAQETDYRFADTSPVADDRNLVSLAPGHQNPGLRHTQSKSPSYYAFDPNHNSNMQPCSSNPDICPPADAVPSKPPFLTRNWSAGRAEWHLAPLHPSEGPLNSPAATESSQASLNQQAPSLVSDNQSNCSISPKTVTSPRAGMPAPQDLTVQMWPELCPNRSSGTHHEGKQDRREKTWREIDRNNPSATGLEHSTDTDRPALSHTLSLPGPLAVSSRRKSKENSLFRNHSTQTPEASPRDARMNVSNLLG
ncbi:hypothetical protein A1O1_04095 [Capronia coronata CBS 617.96]|uniref:Myb-like DNA-binding protein FlbD n=1 Tax=Capronia coronata CBS 617.96 TaxID=1182541 RepID=W9YEN4_9EURO|nr:uncharacterized protein A1O1_04095 [Capronia coronata CBS 617.96]EXJ90988.1 hypothetical protein A1O1_04095 [Capronia coronata CBS 617.96]